MTTAFIEKQFPVSKVSKESYKERKAGATQTLTRPRQVVGAQTLETSTVRG